jgi:hypothetical protein
MVLLLELFKGATDLKQLIEKKGIFIPRWEITIRVKPIIQITATFKYKIIGQPKECTITSWKISSKLTYF